ncbi:peptidylprolyl isomerase [Bacillus sp. ISL-46]|uniref:peptidylprolyl isomerase n=1 Tax=Bacillus sp. ISL-46 TaxID=2819129 RepID=UPI001BEA3716|nr:peptidylprolyl isomerase [Bacillus sp. ISL-46]MBT2723600.1 peptidylprolyl isomerase [Bacillus sp. ISL-46]
MSLLKQNKKTVLIILVLLITMGISLSFALKKDETVAKFNGEAISKDDLYSEMVEQYGAATVDKIIGDKIVAAEAKKQKINITNSILNKEVEKLKASYGGEEAFKQALESNNTTLAFLKQDLKNYLTIKQLLEPQIEITEEEMKTYFDENKDSFADAEQIKASHILVADEKTANEVKQKLNDGGDFAELAKDYSTDDSTKDSGGDLGYFAKETMVTEFEDVAFGLAVDQVSKPVKTEYGYHIIKVEAKKKAKEANYNDSKEEIKETLVDQKIDSEYTTWLENKKKSYDIENTLEEV